MTTAPDPGELSRFARTSGHLVPALLALVAIGGATRVMEAGLACPDWPLCYRALLPVGQMNLQVFLEWFHRLDAFLISVSLLVMQVVSILRRRQLPRWVPVWMAVLLMLVAIQGGLGALTVLALLPPAVVTGHLVTALLLVALLSAGHQRLRFAEHSGDSLQHAPTWWKAATIAVLGVVASQCLLGGLMASHWAAHLCLTQGSECHWLLVHRRLATPAALAVGGLVATGWLASPWCRRHWGLPAFSLLLVGLQMALGVATLRHALATPLITVGHQLVASLLVASLAALTARSWSPIPAPPDVPPVSVDRASGPDRATPALASHG